METDPTSGYKRSGIKQNPDDDTGSHVMVPAEVHWAIELIKQQLKVVQNHSPPVEINTGNNYCVFIKVA